MLLSELMRQTADTSSGPSGHAVITPSSLAKKGRGGSGRDPVLAGLTLDSRKVKPGYLFAAVTGSRTDGAVFVADAV